MRSASDVWFETNPFDEKKEYTGPGRFTFGSTFKRTKVASYKHDGRYMDEPNAYLRFNMADARWGQEADPDDPITYFGKTIWDLKRIATGAYDEWFGDQTTNSPDTKEETMAKRKYTKGKTSNAKRYRGRATRARIGSTSGPKTWRHMKQCIEMKFHDDRRFDVVIPQHNGTAITKSVIDGIDQGTAATERIGIKSYIWDLSIRGKITLVSKANLDADDEVRVLVVLDKQPNGLVATLDQIIEFDNGINDHVLAFPKESNKGRFNILFDRYYPLNIKAAAGNGTANDSAQLTIPLSFRKRWATGLKTMYSQGEGGTNASIVDNNVLVYAYAKNGIYAKLAWESRIHFTD